MNDLALANPRLRGVALVLLAASLPFSAHADEAASGQYRWVTFAVFAAVIVLTMWITYVAARKVRSAADFYTAGGGITGFQNGLAIAGDYMSAATLLGLSSMIYAKGFDGFIYTISFFVGWPIILFVLAERLRNLGKFTFADIASFRLDQTRIRTFAAFGSFGDFCKSAICFCIASQVAPR